MLSGILPSKLLQDAEKNFKKRKISQERWDSSCQIVCSNPKIKKLWQRAKLLGECPNKFVPHYGHNPKFGTIGQAGWNFSSQRIILNVEMLQSEQMTNFLWNFTIKTVISQVGDPKKGKVSNVRCNSSMQFMAQQFQSYDSSMVAATCNAIPVTKLDRIIP